MKFADSKIANAFLKIFGNETQKVLLIPALGLDERKKIIELWFRNTFQLPHIAGLKPSVIDVKVKAGIQE